MRMPRTIIAAMLMVLAGPGAEDVHAQVSNANIGAFAARHGVGLEAAVGLRSVSLFARAEGFETRVVSGGIRAHFRMSGGSVYASGFVGEGRCPVAAIGGVATGCDGEWHTLVGAALGLELDVNRRISLFVDGGRFHMTDSSTDLPPWTFAAGARLHLIARE